MNDSLNEAKVGLFAVLALSLGLAGCSSSTGTVRGKVYFGDVLLKGGSVTFHCADGRAIRTGVREDGSYLVEKVPVGKVMICVDTSSLSPERLSAYSHSPPPGKAGPPGGTKPPSPEAYVEIPRMYEKPETTDLTYEVKGGSQNHDIKMK